MQIKRVVLSSTEPITDGGRKYNWLYLTGAILGIVLAIILEGDFWGGMIFFFVVDSILAWTVKNLIVKYQSFKLRDMTFICQFKVPYGQLIQGLQPNLIPLGMTIEKGQDGNPVILYKNLTYDVTYNEDDTFTVWWRQSVVRAFLTSNYYISIYRNASVAYGMIAYYVQQICFRQPSENSNALQNTEQPIFTNITTCPNCGNQLTDGARFCSECGQAVQTVTYTTETYNPAEKPKSKIVVILLGCFMVVVIFAIILFALAGDSDEQDSVSETRDTEQEENAVFQWEDEHVTAVKNGSPLSYPDQTYGEAFENFFGSPEWEYFVGTKEGTDEDGDGIVDSVEDNVDVVQFTGYCTYQDVEVKALLQFTLSKEDDTFEVTYLSFNEVPQSNLMLVALLERVFGDEDMEDGAENETADYPALYQPVLAQVAQNSTRFQYCLYDLDKDGVMELIVETEEEAGGCYTADIYTIENNERVHLGNEFIYYGSFYETEDGNGLYISYGHMGNEYVSRMTKQGNLISVTEEWTIQTGRLFDFYENDHPVLMCDVTQYDILQNPPVANTAPITVLASNDYICRMSSSRYLTDADLAGLDAFGCKIARNEIYARYSRRFTDTELQTYFDGKSWYYGVIEPDEFDDSILNEYERVNLEFIVQYESRMGYR